MTSKANIHNNFAILRLGLAWLVFMGHFKVLRGEHHLPFPFIYADVAVDGFFIVSGLLITASFDADPNLYRFFVRRVFRLYPLYVTAVVAQAVAMACVAQGRPWDIAHDTLRYVVFNAAFLNFLCPDVAHVVAGLHTPAINPSLWTLKIEVGFYLILPFLWMLMRRQGHWLLGAIFLLSFSYDFILGHLGQTGMAKQLPGQMQFFVLGMALYYYRDAMPPALDPARRLVWGALILAGGIYVTFAIRAPITYPLALALAVFGIACRTRPLTLRLDVSYGIYLAHGPIIQMSQVLGWFHDDVAGFCGTALTVIAAALLAERFVERPFIALGKRLAGRTVKTGAALADA